MQSPNNHPGSPWVVAVSQALKAICSALNATGHFLHRLQTLVKVCLGLISLVMIVVVFKDKG